MYQPLLLASIASSAVLNCWTAEAFSHYMQLQNNHQWNNIVQQSSCGVHHNDRRSCRLMQKSSSSALHAEKNNNASPGVSSSIPSGENYSTLTLLEHMHLLNTNVHKQSTISNDTTNNNKSEMIDFFTNILGFGMDPKSVDNLLSNKGVVFVNAGPSQMHLNDDEEYCQKLDELRQQHKLKTLSGGNGDKHVFEVGLRYDNLEELKTKLANCGDYCSYDIASLGDGREIIRITDVYDRVFVAREAMESKDDGDNQQDEPSISSICQQKVICNSEEQDDTPAEIVEQYALPTSQTACRGMDFIEFFVFVTKEDSGKTVEKIARFYDFFFDATTSVVNDGKSDIAIIAFGKIDDSGRAEQSMLFREVVVDDPQCHQAVHNDDLGTGHHIAIYVGNCDEDFEVAASNCVDGGLLWANPQFEDNVLDVDSAMECKQFRFKNIVDIETGETLYALEHEIRSISHPLFPGN
mmetsp:Transcript_21716/g.35550  ORF Transcript_21716/g.35550 Transcript_21716/m.35550 type:complete len:465 (+) Transcript_21716:165-1559(+)